MYNKIEYIRIYKKQSYKVNKDIPEYIDVPISDCKTTVECIANRMPDDRSINNSISNLMETYDIDIRKYYDTQIIVYKNSNKFLFSINLNQIDRIKLFYDIKKTQKIKLKDFYNLIKSIGDKKEDKYTIFMQDKKLFISIKEENNKLKLYLQLYE